MDLEATEDEVGIRADALVARRLDGCGRRGAARLFASGSVTLDGRVAKKGDRVQHGARVRVRLPDTEGPAAEGADGLTIALERDDLAVVEKPGGQPCAAARAGDRGTLAGAVLQRWPETAAIGHRAEEPGIVHRLDTGTSGLVMVARTVSAFRRLSAALTGGEIDKRYLAVVARGIADSGVVEDAVAPHPKSRKRVVIARPGDSGAHAARSEWRVIQTDEAWSLLELSVSRAYRHQIRVHLASIGYPIAGDETYGGPTASVLGVARHALHAAGIAWGGDGEVAGFRVEAAMPREMRALFDER